MKTTARLATHITLSTLAATLLAALERAKTMPRALEMQLHR